MQDVDGFSCYVTGRFLWTLDDLSDCNKMLFIGWGYLKENSTEHASILQEVQVPLQGMLIDHQHWSRRPLLASDSVC